MTDPGPGRFELPVLDGGASCSLDHDDIATRLAAWHALMRVGLRETTRVDQTTLVARLIDTEEIARDLAALVAAEASCCSFFTFDVRRSEDWIVLTTTTPPDQADHLDVLFASP